MLMANMAHAEPQGLHITYDMSGLPLTISKDSHGTLLLDGLPYPGTVLYQLDTGTLYYQPTESPEWMSVSSADIQKLLNKAKATPGPAWNPWPATDSPQPTQRWDVETQATENADPVRCVPVFGSTYAARMSGVNVMDLTRILAALEWLNAGALSNPCDAANLTPDATTKVGLPVVMTGPNGTWRLQNVVRDDVQPIELPKFAMPVDDTARLNLLLTQFAPEERATFLKANANLPVARQIELMSQQLLQDAQP
jgi:hypothetical protein